MRNVVAVIPKGSQDMVASIIRTIFAQPDREHIEKQFREVTTMLGRSHPKVAAMLIDAQPDLLAFADSVADDEKRKCLDLHTRAG